MTRVAAVDCGTNSCRLLIADLGTHLTDVERRMEITRLGQGVDATGRLAPEALERSAAVLAEYGAAIARLGAERVRVAATSATRDAANAADFAAVVREHLGVEPEVITGEAEAALSYDGAVRGMPNVQSPLVCDIGGGSTELVLSPAESYSMDVGCVRLTERHFGTDDPPTPDQIAAAEADVRAALDEARKKVPAHKAGSFIGVAGTVTTISALAMGLERYDAEKTHRSRISAAEVAAVTGWLLSSTRAERAERPVIHPGRVDVLPAGALILRTICDELAVQEVVVSEHDILDGLAWSLA